MDIEILYEKWEGDRLDIEESMVIELQSISGLSSKIFPIMAQRDTSIPYLTYNLNENERTRTILTHDGLIDARYQFDIFHNSYSSLKALSDLVIAKLKTFALKKLASTGVYCQKCDILDEVRTYDEETLLYQCTIDILISYKEV